MRHCRTSPGPAPRPSVGSGPNAVGVMPPPPGGGAPIGGTVKPPDAGVAAERGDGTVGAVGPVGRDGEGVIGPPPALTVVFEPTSIDCAWHAGQIGMGSPGTGSVGLPQFTQIAVSSFARAWSRI